MNNQVIFEIIADTQRFLQQIMGAQAGAVAFDEALEKISASGTTLTEAIEVAMAQLDKATTLWSDNLQVLNAVTGAQERLLSTAKGSRSQLQGEAAAAKQAALAHRQRAKAQDDANRSTVGFTKENRQAQFVLLNMSRMIQDAPSGLYGMANNMDILVGSLADFRKAVKAGETSWRGLMTALGTAGGIMLVLNTITSLVIMLERFGVLSFDFFTDTRVKATSAADAVKAFNEAMVGAFAFDRAGARDLERFLSISQQQMQDLQRELDEANKRIAELTAHAAGAQGLQPGAGAFGTFDPQALREAQALLPDLERQLDQATEIFNEATERAQRMRGRLAAEMRQTLASAVPTQLMRETVDRQEQFQLQMLRLRLEAGEETEEVIKGIARMEVEIQARAHEEVVRNFGQMLDQMRTMVSEMAGTAEFAAAAANLTRLQGMYAEMVAGSEAYGRAAEAAAERAWKQHLEKGPKAREEAKDYYEQLQEAVRKLREQNEYLLGPMRERVASLLSEQTILTTQNQLVQKRLALELYTSDVTRDRYMQLRRETLEVERQLNVWQEIVRQQVEGAERPQAAGFGGGRELQKLWGDLLKDVEAHGGDLEAALAERQARIRALMVQEARDIRNLRRVELDQTTQDLLDTRADVERFILSMTDPMSAMHERWRQELFIMNDDLVAWLTQTETGLDTLQYVAQETFGGFAQLAQVAFEITGERAKGFFKAFKALSVAEAIISTYVGANKALGQGGIFGAVAAAGVVAAGMANVMRIIATEPGSTGAGGGRTGSPQAVYGGQYSGWHAATGGGAHPAWSTMAGPGGGAGVYAVPAVQAPPAAAAGSAVQVQVSGTLHGDPRSINATLERQEYVAQLGDVTH